MKLPIPDSRLNEADINAGIPVNEYIELSKESFSKVAYFAINTEENFPESRGKYISGRDFDGVLVKAIGLVPKAKWNATSQWVYLIVIDGRVAKIGKTAAGLNSRFTSYQSGTRKNRFGSGSCATTNHTVSEAIYDALLSGLKVEVMGHFIEYNPVEFVKCGKTVMADYDKARFAEIIFTEVYYEHAGRLPVLCIQT